MSVLCNLILIISVIVDVTAFPVADLTKNNEKCVKVSLHCHGAVRLKSVAKQTPDGCKNIPEKPYKGKYEFSAAPGNTITLKYQMYICGKTGAVQEQQLTVPEDNAYVEVLFDKSTKCQYKTF